MTADKRLQFLVRLSDAGTVAATCSLTDMEWVTNQLQRDIYGITSNEHKQFKKEFSIWMSGVNLGGRQSASRCSGIPFHKL